MWIRKKFTIATGLDCHSTNVKGHNDVGIQSHTCLASIFSWEASKWPFSVRFYPSAHAFVTQNAFLYYVILVEAGRPAMRYVLFLRVAIVSLATPFPTKLRSTVQTRSRSRSLERNKCSDNRTDGALTIKATLKGLPLTEDWMEVSSDSLHVWLLWWPVEESGPRKT